MRPFGSVVLGHGVDPVAFLQLLSLHAHHVVLDDLRGLAQIHPLGLRRQRLHAQGQPSGSGKIGTSKKTTIHGHTLLRVSLGSTLTSRVETDKYKFAGRPQKVTLDADNFYPGPRRGMVYLQ